MRIFTGCACALVTPFDAEGRLDAAALARLVRWHIGRGTDALVVCGTTGEASTMTEREQAEAAANAVEAADGRIPVIAGVGGNDTRRVIAACKAARAAGADGALAVTPYYNKTTQAGLIAHYHAIADSGVLPVMVYNVPARTGLNIAPATLQAICRHENVIAVKEANPDVAQAIEKLRLCGEDVAFYSGSDELNWPLMACGFQGVISVASNMLPRAVVELTEAALQGNVAEAARQQLALQPLISALFCETSPIPVKAAMALLGQCEETVRLPLVPMQPEGRARLEKVMRDMRLIV